MGKLIIGSYEDFEKYVGQPLGESDYLQIDQERINLFADATLDHQWIHTDVERAQKESPFKSTIVHGYLTLSVLPYLWNQIIEVHNLKMMINYGMDKMKFGQAVLSGQSVRLSTKLSIAPGEPLDELSYTPTLLNDMSDIEVQEFLFSLLGEYNSMVYAPLTGSNMW